jgi:hypothetical protein
MRALRDRDVTMFSLPQRTGMVDTVFIRRTDAYLSYAMLAFPQAARRSLLVTARPYLTQWRLTSNDVDRSRQLFLDRNIDFSNHAAAGR